MNMCYSITRWRRVVIQITHNTLHKHTIDAVRLKLWIGNFHICNLLWLNWIDFTSLWLWLRVWFSCWCLACFSSICFLYADLRRILILCLLIRCLSFVIFFFLLLAFPCFLYSLQHIGLPSLFGLAATPATLFDRFFVRTSIESCKLKLPRFDYHFTMLRMLFW